MREPTTVPGGLASEGCEACRRGAPVVTEEEIAALHPQVARWERIEREGVAQLCRRFALRDFAEALAFANQIGAIAEEAGHHPALLVEWGGVTVRWWTHKIGGLHRNDFIMAARTDRLWEARGA